MNRRDISFAIEDCRETIYLATKDILLEEYDGELDVKLTLNNECAEYVSRIFIDDIDNSVAVIVNGEACSLFEFDLQDMILITDQL